MTQWIGIVSIVVSIIGIYYKRKEIKKVFNRQPATPHPSVYTRPVEAMPVQRRVLWHMD